LLENNANHIYHVSLQNVEEGCQGYLCTIKATEQKVLDFSEIRVVKKCPTVFQ